MRLVRWSVVADIIGVLINRSFGCAQDDGGKVESRQGRDGDFDRFLPPDASPIESGGLEMTVRISYVVLREAYLVFHRVNGTQVYS